MKYRLCRIEKVMLSSSLLLSSSLCLLPARGASESRCKKKKIRPRRHQNIPPSTTAAHHSHRNFLIICDRDNQSLANQSRKRHEHDLHQYTNGNHHQSSVARDQNPPHIRCSSSHIMCGVFFFLFSMSKKFSHSRSTLLNLDSL